ncbi:hypothetical protein CRG98_043352 [Punica granatum]|uniref:Uncharacterized protein n=1 Tax=Punica granatum TaxID=22663 RepID=A0A2I0HX34_PUNGR|nr:hypothetical protein CRG98_043352 [Punica granatum]
MRGFTPPRELYRALHPFTSIGKGSDQEVRTAVMRAWSSVAAELNEAGGRGASEDAVGGRCVGRAPEYAGSMPAGVRGGGACVGGG